MKYNGLDIYEIVFDDDSVFNNVAIVTAPAIMENFIKLSKQEDCAVRMKLDEDRHIVTGPVLIPDQPIYRDQGGHRFYIKWAKDTIESMAINFFKNHRNTEGNVEHQVPVNGITYYESYIINKERGICPVEFEDLPDGTWVLSAKVNNDDVWNLIKSGDLTGFSIDVSNISFKEDKPIDSLEELIEYLNK